MRRRKVTIKASHITCPLSQLLFRYYFQKMPSHNGYYSRWLSLQCYLIKPALSLLDSPSVKSPSSLRHFVFIAAPSRSTSIPIRTVMAKLVAFCILLLLSSFLSGGTLTMANEQKTWCVAKPSSDQATLLANINYACSQVDCRILQKGCTCFYPDTLINHASIAMNLYYQSRGRNHWNCDFRNSALIVATDPSYANCIYA